MNASGTVREQVKRATERFRELKSEGKAIHRETVKLMQSFENDLRDTRPKLAPSTSKEECLEACGQLIKRGKRLSRQQYEIREEWDYRVEEFQSDRLELFTFLLRLKKSKRSLDEKLSDKIGEMVYQLENYVRIQSVCNDENDDILVQGEIQKMMENQEDEAKEWVLIQKNPFAAHLDRPTGPFGLVSDRRSTPRDSIHLPPEIVSLIMSHCDLENCVNLRLVNSNFFQAYSSHCDHVLRDKLSRRYPWFLPEEDISSWAACALVYVKRLKRGKKWSVTDDLSKLNFGSRKTTPVKTLLAKEVDSEENSVVPFNSFKIENSQREFWNAQVSVNQEGETVVQVKDFDKQIVLPPGTDFETHAVYMPFVVLLRDTMVVRHNQTTMWVFPKSDPHYKRALNTHTFHFDAFELSKVFGVVINRPYVGERELYNFLDNRTGTLREFAPPTHAEPVASYNGLMWWKIKEKYLVPTFIDVDDPHKKIYYRKDKIISVKEDGLYQTQFYQCDRKDDGSSRFVISSTRRGVLFIDLATSTVTEVISQAKDVFLDGQKCSDRVKWFPGFVEEKFDVKFEAIPTIEYSDDEGSDSDSDDGEDSDQE